VRDENDNTISVTEPQFVTCKFCQREFVTELTVSYCADDDIGTMYHGEVRRKLSRMVASNWVAKKLSNVKFCDPVPCPGCLRYQPYMARQMAREPHLSSGLSFGWGLVLIGIALTILGVLSFLMTRDGKAQALTTAVVGVVLIGLGGFVVGRVRRTVDAFDPDASPEAERRRAADECARSLAEYDRKQQRRAGRLYAEYVPKPPADKPGAEPEPLVLTWWVLPSFLTDGGPILIELPDARSATVEVPEVARDGVTLDPVCPAGVRPFKVLVRAFRVHPDEYERE
jgi:uncharacterized membrane protein